MNNPFAKKVVSDEKARKHMRRVYGYRLKDGTLADNLLALPYMPFDVCENALKANFLLAVADDKDVEVDGVDVDYLGVWHKDRMKFDFVHPVKVFSLSDVLAMRADYDKYKAAVVAYAKKGEMEKKDHE